MLRLLFGAILGLLLAGLITVRGEVIALALPLFAYLGAAVLQKLEKVDLEWSREVDPIRAAQDKPVSIHLVVTNRGSKISEMIIEDTIPSGLELIEGDRSAAASLASGESLELKYQVRGKRGEYPAFVTWFSACEPTGCFEVIQKHQVEAPLLVLPHYPRLEQLKIRPPQTRGFAGPIPARQAGAGVDFFGLREYQPGDPQRHINWRVAARHERDLFTNTFEQERVADVGIILDAREPSNVVTGSGSLFEHSVRAAASLAERFLEDGNRVSLLVYGAGIERIYPGYGKIQHERILRTLARTSPGLNYALENLENLPTRLFPSGSQIVLVSPLIPEDSTVLVQMRAHGYAVLVVSPDPVAFEAAYYSDNSSSAYRLAHVERLFMLQRIRRAGVQVVNWQVEKPVVAAIQQALAGQPAMIRRR